MTIKMIDNPRRALQQGGLKLLIYSGIPPEGLAPSETEPLVTLPLTHKPSYNLHEIAFMPSQAEVEISGEPTYFYIVSREDEIVLRGDVGMDMYIEGLRVLPHGDLLTIRGLAFHNVN